jgi:hypothetical protein
VARKGAKEHAGTEIRATDKRLLRVIIYSHNYRLELHASPDYLGDVIFLKNKNHILNSILLLILFFWVVSYVQTES